MQYSTSWLRADPSLIHQFCRKRPYSNKPVIWAPVPRWMKLSEFGVLMSTPNSESFSLL